MPAQVWTHEQTTQIEAHTAPRGCRLFPLIHYCRWPEQTQETGRNDRGEVIRFLAYADVTTEATKKI